MRSFKSSFYRFMVGRALARTRRSNPPLHELRAQAERNSERMFKLPPGVRSEPAQVGGRPGEWLRPEAPRGDAILLYLHGGAYVQGSAKTHRGLAGRIALACRTPAFVLDYRLAPEHPFPAGLDDACDVYRALKAAHAGVPIAIAGDSAGGGLALATALRLRDEGAPAPAALALLSPWTDLTLSNPSHDTKASVDPFFPDRSRLQLAAGAYAGTHDLGHALISPQWADLRGLPPTLIHVGEEEALLDDSRRMAQGMSDCGTEVDVKVYPGMWHVWQVFGGRFREADHSISELGRFLHARLNPIDRPH